MDIRFLLNLRNDTTSREVIMSLRPRGWLGAPANVSASLREKCKQLRTRGRFVFADNGNYARVGKAAAGLADEADRIRDAASDISRLLERDVTRKDFAPAYHDLIDEVADEVAEAAALVADLADENLREQLTLRPTHLIGSEDITAALLLKLGIEVSWVRWTRASWRKRNERVADLALAARSEVPDSLADSYYPVASALDYATAFDAGKVFAAAGHDSVAMGFGAYMADHSYVYSAKIGSKVRRFDRKVPNRYLRTAIVAHGFFAGYESEAGRRPRAFHFLGLGAPIMMAIVARLAYGVERITFDAMSPILDAVEATLYTNKPAYLKIRTWRSAQRLARPGEAWRCPCPFCRRFTRDQPFDYDQIQQAATRLDRQFKIEDLRPGGEIYDFAPLLSEPSGGDLRAAVTNTRMGHNHWVLQGICKELGKAAGSWAEFKDCTDEIVANYCNATNSESFAEAIRIAAEIGDHA